MATVINISTSSRSRRNQDPIEGNFYGWHSQFGRQIASLGNYRVECWAMDVAVAQDLTTESDRVTYRIFPARPSLAPSRELSQPMLQALRKAASQDRVIIHLHDYHSWQAYWIALSLKRVPVVAHYHGATQRPIQKLRTRRRFLFAPILLAEELAESRAVRNIDHFLLANLQGADYFTRRSLRFSFCPMAPDLNVLRPVDRREARAAIGEQTDALILLHVGGFARPKNLELLIAAFDRLRRDLPIKLYLLGRNYDPNYRKQILADIHRRGFGSIITIGGLVPRQKLNAYYNAADALAVTSRQTEGGPVAALEALAVGTPVVSTPVGFMPEMAKRAPGFITLTEERPTSIAQTLASVIAYARLRPDGRRVAHPWTWDDVRRTVDPLYRQLLGSPR